MSESPLKKEISEAMKTALRAKEKARLGTIRLALAEIKKIEIDERIDPDDARIVSILDKMIKQRRESIRLFEAAGRDELVAQEKEEIEVLKDFLPQPIAEEELDKIIDKAISDSGAESMQDMGKVMGVSTKKLMGKADGKTISTIVREFLS